MKRALATALIVVGTTLTLPVGPAQAHDGGQSACVTKHEWRHVVRGMRKARVHRIFDVRGVAAGGGAGGYTRRYRPCAWDGGTDVRLYVTYNGRTNRVAEKRIV